MILDKKGESVKQLDIPLDCKSIKYENGGLFVRSDVRQAPVEDEEINFSVSDANIKMTDASLSAKKIMLPLQVLSYVTAEYYLI